MIFRAFDDITTDELISLYNSVGWTTYSKDRLTMAKLLPGASYYIGVRDEGRLIGLIRCISDEVSIVYIQDILVHPDRQRQGIATELMHQTLAHYTKPRQVVLLTDNEPKSIAFYESLGMKKLDDKAPICCFVKLK